MIDENDRRLADHEDRYARVYAQAKRTGYAHERGEHGSEVRVDLRNGEIDVWEVLPSIVLTRH